jgi:hypothetical protein
MNTKEAVKWWSTVCCGRSPDWDDEDMISQQTLAVVIDKVANPLREKIERIEELSRRLVEAASQTGDPISAYIAGRITEALKDTP